MNIYVICFNDSIELAFPLGTILDQVTKQKKVLKDEYVRIHRLKEFPSNIYVHYHEVEMYKA